MICMGDPALVIEAGGVRVGLLALGYHNTHQTSDPENVQGLECISGIEAARRYVPMLRHRSEVVVIVSHQGYQVDEMLAREVPGIDLIIGGHSHDLFEHPRLIGRTWIAQALSDAAAPGEVRVSVVNGRIEEVTGTAHILWGDQLEPYGRMAGLIRKLREPYRQRLEEVIATAIEWIDRQYKSESPFDKLVGGILREYAGAEVAFLPGLGYGISLHPGPVTREQLYTLLPHPANIVTLNLTGSQIMVILEQSAANQAPQNPLDGVGGLIQTHGMRWTADLRQPAGQRIGHVFIGDAPLEPDRRYRVVTHSGMLAGIHGYSAFAEGSHVGEDELQITDLVEERLRTMGRVYPPPLGDITLIK
ncbi:MAG: bifunctional metallophosphatase/5'-nucleotidase [bacterium]